MAVSVSTALTFCSSLLCFPLVSCCLPELFCPAGRCRKQARFLFSPQLRDAPHFQAYMEGYRTSIGKTPAAQRTGWKKKKALSSVLLFWNLLLELSHHKCRILQLQKGQILLERGLVRVGALTTSHRIALLFSVEADWFCGIWMWCSAFNIEKVYLSSNLSCLRRGQVSLNNSFPLVGLTVWYAGLEPSICPFNSLLHPK